MEGGGEKRLPGFKEEKEGLCGGSGIRVRKRTRRALL